MFALKLVVSSSRAIHFPHHYTGTASSSMFEVEKFYILSVFAQAASWLNRYIVIPLMEKDNEVIFMRTSAIIVMALSIIAIVLYWSPVPIVLGDMILGGYPWIAPKEAKTAMLGIGLVITAVFTALSVVTYYISSKLENLEEEMPERFAEEELGESYARIEPEAIEYGEEYEEENEEW